MHSGAIDHWTHDHTFNQDLPRSGERRTLIVIGLTATMMLVEIAAGLAFGSMALLADGLHMASHTAALAIAAVAYIYARRQASNRQWTFGTGKINALAGFASAVILMLVAGLMVFEALDRLWNPVAIAFDEAILVAFAGLAVNLVSAVILGAKGHEDHHHGASHNDHNLRAAYLHVLADALTSVLAIAALVLSKLLGSLWADPLIAIVGAVLVARWSWSLLRDSSAVLLDRQAADGMCRAIETAIENDGDNLIADLHVWSIGPGLFAAIISVITHEPKTPNYYKSLIPSGLKIAHLTVEVHHCRA